MAAEAHLVAAVGGLAENAGPKRAGGARRHVPNRLQVSERGGNVGLARAPRA